MRTAEVAARHYLHAVFRQLRVTSRGDLLRFVLLDGVAKPGILDVPDTSLLFAAYQEIAS